MISAIITLARLKQTFLENIEALGTPLVSPVFQLLEEAIPAATAVGKALASIGVAGLPILTAALQAATPLIQAFAEGIAMIPPEALTLFIALSQINRIAYGPKDFTCECGSSRFTHDPKRVAPKMIRNEYSCIGCGVKWLFVRRI